MGRLCGALFTLPSIRICGALSTVLAKFFSKIFFPRRGTFSEIGRSRRKSGRESGRSGTDPQQIRKGNGPKKGEKGGIGTDHTGSQEGKKESKEQRQPSAENRRKGRPADRKTGKRCPDGPGRKMKENEHYQRDSMKSLIIRRYDPEGNPGRQTGSSRRRCQEQMTGRQEEEKTIKPSAETSRKKRQEEPPTAQNRNRTHYRLTTIAVDDVHNVSTLVEIGR